MNYRTRILSLTVALLFVFIAAVQAQPETRLFWTALTTSGSGFSNPIVGIDADTSWLYKDRCGVSPSGYLYAVRKSGTGVAYRLVLPLECRLFGNHRLLAGLSLDGYDAGEISKSVTSKTFGYCWDDSRIRACASWLPPVNYGKGAGRIEDESAARLSLWRDMDWGDGRWVGRIYYAKARGMQGGEPYTASSLGVGVGMVFR